MTNHMDERNTGRHALPHHLDQRPLGSDRSEQPVEWAGRTFGELSADEQRRAARRADRQLSAELAASSDAISAVLDQPLP